jgi:hypothetical protein
LSKSYAHKQKDKDSQRFEGTRIRQNEREYLNYDPDLPVSKLHQKSYAIYNHHNVKQKYYSRSPKNISVLQHKFQNQNSSFQVGKFGEKFANVHDSNELYKAFTYSQEEAKYRTRNNQQHDLNKVNFSTIHSKTFNKYNLFDSKSSLDASGIVGAVGLEK